jgi:hypothetical protein
MSDGEYRREDRRREQKGRTGEKDGNRRRVVSTRNKTREEDRSEGQEGGQERGG